MPIGESPQCFFLEPLHTAHLPRDAPHGGRDLTNRPTEPEVLTDALVDRALRIEPQHHPLRLTDTLKSQRCGECTTSTHPYRSKEECLRRDSKVGTMIKGRGLGWVFGGILRMDYHHSAWIFPAATSARRYTGPCASLQSGTGPLHCGGNLLWAAGT